MKVLYSVLVSRQNWIKRTTGASECIEAFFVGAAYAPHRHDTYTFALTTFGVQSFSYRGQLRHSRPGEAVILHPDELHDGQAGTDVGFGYRSVCVSPSKLQTFLGGLPLPFHKTGVSRDPRLISTLKKLTSELEAPLDEQEREDLLFTLATDLQVSSGVTISKKRPDYRSVKLAKQYIDAHIFRGFALADLEAQTGQNRWQLSRDFRSTLGTSPYRYLIMRRLEKARSLLFKGHTISDAAYALSFSDQSHFTRHFRAVYGMSPKAWLSSVNAHCH